jgi:putative membrane protein
MRENKSVRNSLIIAAAVIGITVSFLIIYNIRQGSPVSTGDGSLVSAKKGSPASEKGVIEIKEKMFISQVNDVYANKEDYLGKTIKLEGLFKVEQGYDKSYCFVLRYGPGCCGYDGNVGFEVAWDKDKEKPYPGEDAWVEATGELKTYEEDGEMEFLYLDLISLNVLDKRGKETVLQ